MLDSGPNLGRKVGAAAQGLESDFQGQGCRLATPEPDGQIEEQGRPIAGIVGSRSEVSDSLEVFVDLGLTIKRLSPFRTTFVVELSQAVETAYIPTRSAYAGGGYEVTNSTVQPGSGELLVEAAIRLLRESASELAAATK